MRFFVYIIYSPSRDQYYTGSTSDLTKRLDDHTHSRSKFNKGTKDWTLTRYQEFSDRSSAVKEEMRIKKKKSRKYLEWLISSVG